MQDRKRKREEEINLANKKQKNISRGGGGGRKKEVKKKVKKKKKVKHTGLIGRPNKATKLIGVEEWGAEQFKVFFGTRYKNNRTRVGDIFDTKEAAGAAYNAYITENGLEEKYALNPHP